MVKNQNNRVMVELILSVLDNYPSSKNTDYPGDGDIIQIIKKQLPKCLDDLFGSLLHEGSAGKGNWAAVPWVASMDENLTTTVSKGVYLVFLFCADGSGVYMTMAQGTGGIEKHKNEKINFIRREKILSVIDPPSDLLMEKGPLPNGSLKAGNNVRAKAYEISVIMWKYYSRDDLSSMENDDPIIEIFHGLSSFYLGVKDIIDEDLQDNQNEVIKRACEKYIMHCNTSTWLADEKYKFNFAQWVSDHIDFNSHTDEEILSLARESQEQNYFEDSNAKGINFILTEKRFKDEFITLDDIAYLRELINQPYEEDEPDVKHDMTYPKIAAWASCFNPSAYKPYAASELAIGLKYLFNLPKSFPKKGFKALQFSQSCLHQLEAFLRTQDEVSNMFKEFLNHSELTELNWAWIAQDFSLFVTRVLANEEEDQNELQLDDTNDVKYWLYAPGRNASKWDEFYNDGIMAIGWKELSDFRDFNSREEIKQKLIEIHDGRTGFMNDSLCCHEFANVIKVGDIVITKKGRKFYLGYGVVTSDYFYDDSREDYYHVRKVDWKKRGEWEETVDPIVIKTLTDITKYPEYVDRIKELIGMDSEHNHWWLNANPKIWKYSDIELNGSQTYTTYNDRGNKRRIYSHMAAVKPGDTIIGYASSPIRKITALLEISKGIHENGREEVFEIKKTEDLDYHISFDELKKHPELKNCEPIINNQGSLFKLTTNEFEIIMNLIADRNPKEQDQIMVPYTIADATKDLFMSEENFKEYLGLLVSKKNIVLQGPPGVGKTFVAKRLAYSLLGSKDDTKVEMIQFHQSYAYEDFIQGYRPNPDSDGGFTLTTGIFYNICKRAENNPQSNYVLVIDEINRGNLSKIFGELLMLIETDKRGGEYQLSLTYAPAEKFSVPENMYLIGTMNTADRSIAMVDYALRRRFSFISLMPEFNKRFDNALKSAGFSKKLRKNIIDRVSVLNEEIRSDKNNLGDGYQIGHSYFCPDGSKPYNDDWYNRKIKYEIEPLLKEYWFDEQERVDGLLENLLIDS